MVQLSVVTLLTELTTDQKAIHMSATKAQINWASVTFGSTAITRITTGGLRAGGQAAQFKGDTDMYSTIIANVTNEPHATFTTADVGTVMGITPGTTNTLAATLNDAKGQPAAPSCSR